MPVMTPVMTGLLYWTWREGAGSPPRARKGVVMVTVLVLVVLFVVLFVINELAERYAGS
jgi:hypothetical protein